MFSLDEIERQMQATQLGGPLPSHQYQPSMEQAPPHRMPGLGPGPEPRQGTPHGGPFDHQPRPISAQQQQGRPESTLFKGDIGDLLDFPPLGGQGQALAGRPVIREQMPDAPTPEQIIELSVEKRAALMRDAQEKIKATERLEAKRRRKAEKLAHMARRNELMSQGDKDFITRIQVSQLVTEDPYADDFYAQVFGAIVRGRLGEAASGEAVIKFGDVGVGMGIGRGAGRREKAMERMRQQVEKLVQHAKAREKEKNADRECGCYI
jgi:DNA topoisomerase 2-associated protein PAT1